MNKKNLIAGSAIAVFIVGIVMAGRYAALAPAGGVNAKAAQSAMPIAPSAQSPMAAMSDPAHGKVDSVEVMVERLRTRLEKEPSDVNGWVLLGRSYHYLERWDDAKAAFAKARELGYQGGTDTGADAAASEGATMHASGGGDAVFNDIGRVGSMPAEGEHAATKGGVEP